MQFSIAVKEPAISGMTTNLIRTLLLAAFSSTLLHAQPAVPADQLDPARDPGKLHRVQQTSLPEQYIWTAGDAAALRPDHAKFNYRQRQRKIDAHVFRSQFQLKQIPSVATLYIARPRSAKAYLNGKLVLDATAVPKSPLEMHVFRAEVHSALRRGPNLLAIEAVRGWGIVAASDSRTIQQLSFGETLAAKIVPASPGIEAPPLVYSSSSWRSVAAAPQGWQSPDFDDHGWPHVQALGAIESSPEFFQWNLDAGLYAWPGYTGMSPYLRTYSLPASAVTHRTGDFENVNTLTVAAQRGPLVVRIPAGTTETNAPSLLIDFGREVSGRLLVESACDCAARILLSYGESEGEALSGENYLGTNLMTVPPHGTARGPKSGFRYAWLRFVGGAPLAAFRSIRLEGIAYPVQYAGSFASSDPLLNRIWQTAAYTAHLCMQDGVWDAPKRDRGWWAGDLAVSGPVISQVFADRFLLDDTLTHLIPAAGQDVNGIPGYTALWIITLADLYRHSGDKLSLEEKHTAILRLLQQMDAEIDASGRFLNPQHRWLFVDWSPGLFAFTNEAEEGTELEFVLGFRDGAWLLSESGDTAAARLYHARAIKLAAQARHQFLDANGVFSDSWQLNAMAVLAGVATPQDYPTIWTRVFRKVGSNGTQAQTISPYFNDFLIEAMAQMGHRGAAVNWIREYWGGMLAEGATSFWEAYDLRWDKENARAHLQADGTTGYFVSLAHGWSAGPASWLMEQLLGVTVTGPASSTVQIRPELAGLRWVRGAVATPRGPIRVSADTSRIQIQIPEQTEATVLLPIGTWLRNGSTFNSEPAESGARLRTVLRQPGNYEFVKQ
jgi:alpha-L-rhamnosidase